jgi:hypothetical protein
MPRRRRLLAPGLTVLLVLVLAASPVSAEIYRWTDDRGTAHYADGLENVPEAFRARAVPVGLRNSPASSDGAPAPAPAAGPGTIRFTPGQRILVDARINGSTSARLLLDTGADRTLIDPRTLIAAGASLTRGTVPGQIRGVTGTTGAENVRIESLEVGDIRVGRMLVIAHDMNQPGIDGLLGRDFLQQFNVTIDTARGIVTIAPR